MVANRERLAIAWRSYLRCIITKLGGLAAERRPGRQLRGEQLYRGIQQHGARRACLSVLFLRRRPY